MQSIFTLSHVVVLIPHLYTCTSHLLFFFRSNNPNLLSQASISYADQSSIQSVDLRFTDPAAPLFGRCESLDCEMLFIISTMQIRGEDIPGTAQRKASQRENATANGEAKKRAREDDTNDAHSQTRLRSQAQTQAQQPPNGTARSVVGGNVDARRRPMKVVQRSDAPGATAASISASFAQRGSDNTQANTQTRSQTQLEGNTHANLINRARVADPPSHALNYRPNDNEPLFLPSQHSVAADEALREAGLGLEEMNENEILEMLEGDGEEVGFNIVGSQFPQLQNKNTSRPRGDENNMDDAYADMDVDADVVANQNIEEEGQISTPEIETSTNIPERCKGPDSLEIYEEEEETMEFGLGPTQRPQRTRLNSEENEKVCFYTVFTISQIFTYYIIIGISSLV